MEAFMKKINAIEGFRGVACLGIMLSHFAGAFYDWENMWFWGTPLQIFFSAEAFLRVFFTLSGFVVGYKYFKKKNWESIPLDIINRYTRLIPMVFLTTIITYLMMKGHLLFNQEAAVLSGSTDFLGTFNTFSPSLKDCLKNIFVGTFSELGNAYVGPYWTLPYELLGVIMVLGFLAAFRENRLRYIVYAVAVLFIKSYYAYFFLGVMISDFYFEDKIRAAFSRNQYVNTVLLVLIFFAMGMLDHHIDSWPMKILFDMLITAFMLLLITNKPADRILGNRIGRFLGRISFGMYSFHWLVTMSLSSYMYIRTANHSLLMMILIFIVMFAVTILISYPATLFNEQFGKLVLKLENRIGVIGGKESKNNR